MPRVGIEPTISVFERAKTVHALDRAGTGIGLCIIYTNYINYTEHLYMNPYVDCAIKPHLHLTMWQQPSRASPINFLSSKSVSFRSVLKLSSHLRRSCK
jgi:hypothetical protein